MTVKGSGMLLNNKADPNIYLKRESPLYIASDDGHGEIVKLLLNYKADPNICSEGGSEILL
jgi:ankyrin repeat protein